MKCLRNRWNQRRRVFCIFCKALVALPRLSVRRVSMYARVQCTRISEWHGYMNVYIQFLNAV